MSSTPSTPASPRALKPVREPPSYRQTEYYDGRDRCIVESRRHSSMACPTMLACPPKVFEPPPYALRTGAASEQSENLRQLFSPGSSRLSAGSRAMVHVTMKSPEPYKEAVVLEKGVQKKSKKAQESPIFFESDVTNPPPTPRINRLATPELDELDERPFCACCTRAHMMKYCTSCGCKPAPATH